MAQDEGVDLKRGLKDVYLDTTSVTFIDGERGRLAYRGYSIHDLALHSTFEETIFLLVHGRLPTKGELQEQERVMRDGRVLPQEVKDLIRSLRGASPMDVLRTGVSALAAFDPETADNSTDATIRKGLRLTSQAVSVVATHDRLRRGLDPVEPRRDLGHAANLLCMLRDEEVPEQEARILDQDFILHADHGSNASAFAARVAASTLADVHGAVTAGVATLKGPLHGGAAETVRKMTLEIGEPEKAGAYVKDVVARGGRIMGFGHRVYKAEDPRARHMREGAQRLGYEKGHPEWFQILSRVADAMKPYESRGIYQNVDFWSGAIYTLLGIPDDLFVPVFAMGRVPGWAVQVLEQWRDNVLIRPRLRYEGPAEREYVPIEDR